MSEIVELDERGTIQLPRNLLTAVKPHTRFVLEVQGETIVLRPVTALPFWQIASRRSGQMLHGSGLRLSARLRRLFLTKRSIASRSTNCEE